MQGKDEARRTTKERYIAYSLVLLSFRSKRPWSSLKRKDKGMRKSKGTDVKKEFVGCGCLHKEKQFCTISNSRWKTGGEMVEQQDMTERAGDLSHTTKKQKGSKLCNATPFGVSVVVCFLCSPLHPSCSIFPSTAHSLFFPQGEEGKHHAFATKARFPVRFLPPSPPMYSKRSHITRSFMQKISAPTNRRGIRKVKLRCPLLCYCLLHYPMGWGFPVAYMIGGTLYVTCLRCMFALVNRSTTIIEDRNEKNVMD